MARVVSCRFLRLGCSEDDHPLFRREYARNNRERGVKLLRCFPHCCPEHVKRSYCGCSVHVLVTFSADVSEMPLDELRVCARFEPTRVAPLWPAGLADIARNLGATGATDGRQENRCRLEIGERVELPDDFPTATGQNTDNGGVWVLAEKESEANHRGLAKNVALYALNNRMSPKWFYNYDSSITRAQREMTHHLVAYVFQALPGGAPHPSQRQEELHRQPERLDGVVVARHASPGFFLVSYRRSGAASNPGCALPALPVDGSVDNDEISASEIRSASRIVQQQAQQQHRLQVQLRQHHQEQQQLHWHQQQRQRQQYTANTAQDHNSHRATAPKIRRADYQETTGSEKVGGTDSNDYAEDMDDGNAWLMDVETRRPGFCEKAQHLLILWKVIQCIWLQDLENSTDTEDVHVRSHWLRAAAALRAPPISFNTQLEGVAASFLSAVFENVSNRDTQRNSSSNSSRNPFTNREQRTIRVSVHLFLRALSSRDVQHLLYTACRVGNDESTQQDLLNRFVALILDLYEVLGDVLHDVTGGDDTALGSLPALVDDVLSLVYGRTHFGALRVEVSTLLLDQHTSKSIANALNSVFWVFAMQAQDPTTRSASHHFQPPRSQEHFLGDICTPQNLWTRRWLLEPGSVQTFTFGHGGTAPPDTSLVAVAQLLRELGCIDIETTRGGDGMKIQSALSFAGGTPMASMELVFDGQLREFSALPSGLSSRIKTADGWCIGDYVAVLSEDAQAVDIHFFAFKENISASDGSGGVTTARQVSMSLILEQEQSSGEGTDRVHPRDLFVVVHGTVMRSTYSCVLHLADMSLQDRGTIWNELSWTPMVEISAGYVAL